MDVADFLIDEEATMLNAMEQLDKVAKKVLFVIKGGRFVATVTDGDIRRWILKKGNLDAKVREIANYSPKFLYEEEKNRAKEYMKKYSVEALLPCCPNLHPNGMSYIHFQFPSMPLHKAKGW